jgi:ribosomal protein S18 acetylase RimI-like enzyme
MASHPRLPGVFRLSARADPVFLLEMLYEAVYWRDDGRDERPPLESLLDDPHHAVYVEGWGRPGDTAVIAFDRSDEPVGAAWSRHFPATAPGYGFLTEAIPELAIGVFAEFRGQGVGSLLLGSLIARVTAAGEPALSLSVEPDNPSRQLYVKHGFVVVPSSGAVSAGAAETMVIRLAPS